MKSASLNLPTKACHNCRKRRWRCDRGVPSCQKCLSSGVECLGYGKLFVWNQGIASRGKMMGKGFGDKKEVLPNAQGGGNCVQLEETATSHEIPILGGKPHHTSPQQNDIVPIQRNENETAMVVQRPLVDPLYNDLNQNSRYYLHHFATQICEVMVVYDAPGQNPIRDILPAASAHPLLLQIIIANSAFHIFNISCNPMGHSSSHDQQTALVPTYYQTVGQFGGPLKSSYKDALVAKQQALSLLAQNVASVDKSNIDLVLVTILMFINYALVESGRDKWKVHLDGAFRLVQLLGKPPYIQRPMSRLRQTILSDLLVFWILGSTFTFTALPKAKFVPDTIELEPILRYAETNNYLSCPGPLLCIMLESFALPWANKGSSSTAIEKSFEERLGSLIQRALDFDPISWSKDFKPASPFEDIQKRIHVAAALRSAVCIYLARVLPPRNPLLDPSSSVALVNMNALADDIVHQISHLKPSDPLFKSICWPLFLAGAESDNPNHREWIMNRLDQLYGLMYWGYLHTCKRVLEAIWKYKAGVPDGADNCWVEEVKHLGNEVLIA